MTSEHCMQSLIFLQYLWYSEKSECLMIARLHTLIVGMRWFDQSCLNVWKSSLVKPGSLFYVNVKHASLLGLVVRFLWYIQIWNDTTDWLLWLLSWQHGYSVTLPLSGCLIFLLDCVAMFMHQKGSIYIHVYLSCCVEWNYICLSVGTSLYFH